MKNPKRASIQIDKLHFDRQNPRLPDTMDKANDDDVIHWMLRNGNVTDLMSAIGATGYSNAEAVLAIPLDDNSYEVVEGNRRLAAVKLLNNPSLASVKSGIVQEIVNDTPKENIPTEIPVLIYEDRSDILVYLGYRHITGIKSWGAEEKAKYLKQLYEHYLNQGLSEDDTYKTIAKSVATKPYYAKRTLATLALTTLASDKNYWGIENLTDTNIKFSVLGTALAYAPIYSFIGLNDPGDTTLSELNEEHAAELFKWLFMPIDSAGNSAVRESRLLGTLAKVLSSSEATQQFRQGKALEDAALFTDEADENFLRLIIESLERLEEANRYYKKLRQPSSSMLDTLQEISRTTKLLRIGVNTMMLEGEDDDI